MSNVDIFNMAIRNLFKRKVRTFLTVLGVVAGVLSIVLMISLGIGVNKSFEKQLEQMGDLTIIELYSNAYEGWDKTAKALDEKVMKEITAFKGVKSVSPSNRMNLQIVDGKRTAQYVQVIGVDAEAMADLNYKVTAGELLDSGSVNTFDVIFGADVALSFKTDLERKKESKNSSDRMMFFSSGGGMSMTVGGGSTSPNKESNVNLIKDKLTASWHQQYGMKNPEYTNNKKPDIYTLNGIGILKKSDRDWDSTSSIFMDYRTVDKMIKDNDKYLTNVEKQKVTKKRGFQTLKVKVNSINDVESVIKQLKDIGLEAYSPMEYIQNQKKSTESLQSLLSAIGAVALFVAAIGISNTMIMSIYERTREIGIMKVIGATIRDIKWLFLVEAALIGVFGGILGVGLSYAGSYIINHVGISFLQQSGWSQEVGEVNNISVIPAWLSLYALIFAAAIGLLAGYFPARRAMSLSALSAIKSE